MAEHTPGPWVINDASDPAVIDFRADPDFALPEGMVSIDAPGKHWGLAHVVVRSEDQATDDPELLANACLIAAAPEMADTLKEAERCLGNMIFLAEAAEEHGVASGDIDRARRCLAEIQAIRAKAEGRS